MTETATLACHEVRRGELFLAAVRVRTCLQDSDRIRLDWIGFGWIGSNRIGLDRVGLGWTGFFS